MVDIKKLKEIEKGIVLAINDMTIHLNGLRQIIDEEVGKLPGPEDYNYIKYINHPCFTCDYSSYIKENVVCNNEGMPINHLTKKCENYKNDELPF